jgi:hypothetical protein
LPPYERAEPDPRRLTCPNGGSRRLAPTTNALANVPLSKAGAIRMDVFASSDHIGMIYSKNANGTDQIRLILCLVL